MNSNVIKFPRRIDIAIEEQDNSVQFFVNNQKDIFKNYNLNEHDILAATAQFFAKCLIISLAGGGLTRPEIIKYLNHIISDIKESYN